MEYATNKWVTCKVLGSFKQEYDDCISSSNQYASFNGFVNDVVRDAVRKLREESNK